MVALLLGFGLLCGQVAAPPVVVAPSPPAGPVRPGDARAAGLGALGPQPARVEVVPEEQIWPETEPRVAARPAPPTGDAPAELEERAGPGPSPDRSVLRPYDDPTRPADADDVDLGDLSGLSGVLEALIRTHLPHEYESRKEWGKTKEVWSGVKVSLDGLRIDSERKRKRVNHGQWNRYRIELARPGERLALSVGDVRESDEHRLQFELSALAPLKVFTQVQQWERGVKLASVSSEAGAIVRFYGRFELGLEFDASKLPPDVILKPVVKEARVELVDLKLRRVSQFEGPFVRLAGDGLEQVVERRLAETNERLPERLNRQIAKKQDKLRLSAADWLAKKLGP